jgi:chromosome segregation ATPase
MRYGLERPFEPKQGEDSVSDIAELRNRLVVVEDQVARLIDESAATRAIAAMADRDVADHRQEMRGHTRVLNALRQTQIEQGETLSEQSQTLAEHGRMLSEQGGTLAEHGRMLSEQGGMLSEQGGMLSEQGGMLSEQGGMLSEQGGMLSEQGGMLSEHTATLDRHTATLDQHGQALGTLVAGQAAIMRHLGIDDDDRTRE